MKKKVFQNGTLKKSKSKIELISKTTKIENRVYTKDELRLIRSNIIDGIFSKSSKNGDIQKANAEFYDIIEMDICFGE